MALKLYTDTGYDDIDAQVSKKLGLPNGLLSGIRLNGEKSNADQVSEAGARSVYQITPTTRKLAIEKYGIDPYISPRNAAEVAGNLLKDSLKRNKNDVAEAVGEYHGGTNRANWGTRTKAYIERVAGALIPSAEAAPQIVESQPKITLDPNIMAAMKAFKDEQENPKEQETTSDKIVLDPDIMNAMKAFKETYKEPSEETQKDPGMLAKIGDFFTGNLRKTKETEGHADWTMMPELQQIQMDDPTAEESNHPTLSFMKNLPSSLKNYIKLSAATLLSNPAETAKIIKHNFPNVKVHQDEKGNFILTSDIDGKDYPIQPGARISDAPRILGGLLAFTPAGRATTTAGMMAGSAATQAAIEATQAVSGGEFNKADIAAAGAIPGVFKAVGAVASPIANKITSMIKPTVAEAPLEVAATAENIAASTPKPVIVPENQPHLTVGDEATAASDDAFAAQKQAEYDAGDNDLFNAAQKFRDDQPVDTYGHSRKYQEAYNDALENAKYSIDDLPKDTSGTLGPDDVEGLTRGRFGWTGTVNGKEITVPGSFPKKNASKIIADTYNKKYSKTDSRFIDEAGELTEGGYAKLAEMNEIYAKEHADDIVGNTPSQKTVNLSKPDDMAKFIHKYLENKGYFVNQIGGSGKSNSKYFAVRLNGENRTIRISDHPLPTEHGTSDIELQLFNQTDNVRGDGRLASDGISEDEAIQRANDLISKINAENSSATPKTIPDAQVAEQMTAPKLAETPTATTDEELATLAKKAALGSIGKDKAQKKLAEQVAINPETKAAADNLGFDLEADQMTTNDQFRRLVGLARSEAGSTAEARGYQSVKNSADVADTVMADLDGITDLSLVNQKIKSTLGQTRDSLETEAKTLYNKIDEKILPETPVEMANLKEVLDKTLTGLGGKEGMTSEENRLLKLVENKPTYLALTREKQLIGNALAGKASPYGNTAEGTLKQLYGALASDQHAAIVKDGGDSLGKQFRIANQLTSKRKKLEQRIVNAFGEDRDGSVASAIKSSISTATKGNDAGLAKVLKVVPDDLKKQTLASAIYSLSKEGEQFNFNTYANLYRGLRRNSVAYSTVVKNMGGKETDKILTDLFQVSQGIAKAQSSVLQNGKANQAMLKQLKGAESLVGKVLETTKDAAVKGLAYEAVTSAVGAHGIGLASGITQALASSKTNAVRAVGDVITSPEFKALVEEVATKGKGSPQNIKRVANHWKMRKLGKIVGGELAKPPKDVEKWIIQSIQAANEEKS